MYPYFVIITVLFFVQCTMQGTPFVCQYFSEFWGYPHLVPLLVLMYTTIHHCIAFLSIHNWPCEYKSPTLLGCIYLYILNVFRKCGYCYLTLLNLPLQVCICVYFSFLSLHVLKKWTDPFCFTKRIDIPQLNLFMYMILLVLCTTYILYKQWIYETI